MATTAAAQSAIDKRPAPAAHGMADQNRQDAEDHRRHGGMAGWEAEELSAIVGQFHRPWPLDAELHEHLEELGRDNGDRCRHGRAIGFAPHEPGDDGHRKHGHHHAVAQHGEDDHDLVGGRIAHLPHQREHRDVHVGHGIGRGGADGEIAEADEAGDNDGGKQHDQHRARIFRRHGLGEALP